MTGSSASPASKFPITLVLLGLALRLPGLLFNGMGDLYEILLDWGASVHHLGLVQAFGINYGILSYALFGAAEAAAEWIPRFWWAPYKLLVIGFDLGACLALAVLAAPRDRRRLLLLVWLNPWFIIHGAYHGFWEGPHILFGVLAVLALRGIREESRAWAVAGMLIMCSGFFKPQGLIHFAGPLAVFLAVEYLRGIRRPLLAFASGIAAIVTTTALLLWIAGGSPLALYNNYRSASTVMANMSNGGLGLWRFLSWVYMELTGQPGEVYDLKISPSALAVGTVISGLICLSVLLAFAFRVGLQRREPDSSSDGAAGRRWVPEAVVRWPAAHAAFGFLTLGALVVSQFGPHAHINHSYTALVLLTVWVVQDRALAGPWLALVVMLGVAHLSAFGLGDTRVMLPASQVWRYPQAAALIGQIVELPAYRVPDGLLAFQAMVNRAYGLSPLAVSMMSALVCIVASSLIWRLFQSFARPTRAFPRPPASGPPEAATAAEGRTAPGRPTPPSGS